METELVSPRSDKEAPAALEDQRSGRRHWNPLRSLARLPTFQALHFIEFRLLWFGWSSTAMGIWMDQVARGWLIYQLTNSAVQLGLIRGVQAIPVFLLSPLAGSLADRYSRKKQLMIAISVDGVLYASVAGLIVTGLIQPWHVYVTAVLNAVVTTFHAPVRAAMTADAVPSGHLTNAIGLNSMVFNVSRSTGPALAGLLIAVFGTAGSYAAQALLFFLGAFLTLPVRVGEQPGGVAQVHGKKQAFGRSILDGWRFSWSNETVRSGILITMSASFFIIPFTTLLPIFARDILKVGATGQGLLLTGMGVGALCSAVLIASVGDRLPRGMVMLGGVAMYGLSVVAFSASPWFKLSVAIMMMVGLFHVSSHALVQTVIQTYAPAEFRGRTMAIFQQAHFLHTVGGMLLGVVASLAGARFALTVTGICGASAMVVILLALPRTRHIR